MEYLPPVEPPVTRSTDIGIIIGGIVGGLLLLIILVLILWKVSYNFLIWLNSQIKIFHLRHIIKIFHLRHSSCKNGQSFTINRIWLPTLRLVKIIQFLLFKVFPIKISKYYFSPISIMIQIPRSFEPHYSLLLFKNWNALFASSQFVAQRPAPVSLRKKIEIWLHCKSPGCSRSGSLIFEGQEAW